MTWNRTDAAAAIVAALQVTLGETVWVFDHPPATLNPPAVVVSRPTQVLYSVTAFGVDEATLPVICVGPVDGEDVVDGLIAAVRDSFPDPTLGGVVASVEAARETNWRNMTIAGVEIVQAEVELLIRM